MRREPKWPRYGQGEERFLRPVARCAKDARKKDRSNPGRNDSLYISLGPGVAVFGKGQGADALTVGSEDGVGYGAQNRRQRGFAKAGGRIVRFEIVNGDFDGRF